MSKFTFGTPTTTAASNQSFGFGAQTTTPATGFGSTTFGAAPAQPAAQPAASTSGFNFSFGNNQQQPTQSTQPNTLTLGGTTTTANTGTGLFGSSTPQAQTQQQPQTTGLSFGTPAAAKPAGLTFGTPATTTATGFGIATTSTGLSFGTTTSTSTAGGLSFGAPTTTAASTFSFGAAAAAPATTSAPSLFGSNTGGLFGAKPATTNTLGTSAPAPTQNRGLGGLDITVTNKGLAQGSGNTGPTAAKENLLPNELMQTIDGFKEFVKTQKVLSSDIARGSARPLNRCAEDTASLMELLTTLAGSVQRDRSLADKLKQDTARALQNAEIAQRTHDTPPGLQYENTAPLVFFMELAEQFENDLMLFKSQIETTEKHIQTMMTPKALTPQELTKAMSKLHESLVAVAGKLQSVHSKVQQQKEQYLNFRKYVLKDCTNVFEDINKSNGKSSRNSIGKITMGPTPFGPGNRSFLTSSALNATQPPSYGTPNPLGWGSSNTSSIGGGLSQPPTQGLSFNAPVNLTAPLNTGGDANSSFQLQKPPTGNKRGKH